LNNGNLIKKNDKNTKIYINAMMKFLIR